MQYSYSQVSCFEKCPLQWLLRYKLKLKTIPNQDAANPLYIGTALHKGLETDVETAISEYFQNYYVITDLQVNEAIKLENLIPKAQAAIPQGFHEVPIYTHDFVGYIDLLVPVGSHTYDIWDFKYSNSVDNYMESAQLHLYKTKFEEANPGDKIRSLHYLFVPKTNIRQKNSEDLYQFRERLVSELEKMEVREETVEFNPQKVEEYNETISRIESSTEFPKNKTPLCRFCEYQKFCENGEKWIIL